MEYTIKKGKLALTASEHGAELRSLTWEKKELIWEGKKEVWPRRAPICFPWCGKLAEGKGSFGGWQCKGPQHGFIRDLEHVLAAQEEDLLRFRLSWAGDESWPWAFSFETEHRLTQEGAITTCAVVNAGSQPMAMQLGFHPGFACPFLPGTSVEDYQVRFESGLIVPLTAHLFDNDSIQYQGVGAWARLEHRESGRYIQVGTEGFYCVLLWSQPGIPGFVCIEPWQGYPGPQEALDQRPGAVVLAPGERRQWQQAITLAL